MGRRRWVTDYPQGTTPLPPPRPSALTPRTRVLFLPLFLRLLRAAARLGPPQRLHEHLDVPQDAVQHLLDAKSLGLRRAIRPPWHSQPASAPAPAPPYPLLSPRPALATLGPVFWGEGLVSPFARLGSSAGPDSLRLPRPSLGPRGSGGALEEAERRRLVLGHWSVVTGATGTVACLQRKRTWPLIFNLSLLLPIPPPPQTPPPTLTALWGHPVGLFWRGPPLQGGCLLPREWPFQGSPPPSVLAGVRDSKSGSAEHTVGTQA